MIVIGLLLGSFVDRFSRRKLMVASDLVRCAVFVALPFTTGPAQLVGLAGVVGFATGFFRPALFAGLPNVVDDDELADANGILQAAENITWMLGLSARRRPALVLHSGHRVLVQRGDLPRFRVADRPDRGAQAPDREGLE